MPTRPDVMETLQLAIEMLKRIPKGRSITATQLHEQLAEAGYERDLRTIQRQLEVLSDIEGIERDESVRPYRYQWRSGANGLSLRSLSAQESLLLILAEQQLKSLLPAKLMKSMDGFFAQARDRLSDSPKDKLNKEWLEKIRVVSTSQPLLPPKIAPDVFESVSNALYGNLWLTVVYKNAEGRQDEYRVMPLGLVQQGPRMYLVCRFDGYDDERNLALHRIRTAKVSTLTFDRPKQFDLKKYDDDGRFGYGDGERITLSFTIDKGAGFHILESPLSFDQIVIENDDTYEITATVVDSDMLDWWLAGFGVSVTNIKKMEL